MSDVKELNYFADDFRNVQKISFKSDKDYLKVFEKANKQHIAIGEASPYYLFSEVAFQKMYAFASNAQIIICLRNPVDFIHSYHQLNISLLREDEENLEQAWNLQKLRAHGEKLPKNMRESKLLMYSEIGQFGKNIERLLHIFPRDQIMVVLLTIGASF